MIIGAGYVGLTTGLALAYVGHKVDVIEKNKEKLNKLKSKTSPIYEKGVQELIELVKDNINFWEKPDEVIKEAEIVIIAVGTPPKKNGEADLSYLEDAIRDILKKINLEKDYTLAIKSTVPIGTNNKIDNIIKEFYREKGIESKIHLASNPEFLREGMALYDTLYPDRIVIGSLSAKAISDLQELYKPILQQTFTPPSFINKPNAFNLPHLIITDPTSSEMIKYAANAFLALKISFINEIAGLCEKVGANIKDVARGIGTDKRIGISFLNAGIGWGGSCFPKDTLALLEFAKEIGYNMPIVSAAREVNQRARKAVIDKLKTYYGDLREKTIAVLGLAFKPGTDDVRESPALDIIKILLNEGAKVKACDPVALQNAKKAIGINEKINFFTNPYEAVEGVDAAIFATEWPEWANLDFVKLASKMRTRLFIDGRNFYEPEEVKKAGFTYMGVGR
ncbi:UDP-glucose dehydrogenase family protein [Thermovenabulum sp.]|uniref:UDP-glucose dehydrogenase family protein n=1 Tax=Thermovenabulum sp. TaxID=3100335 RepID=UPI003C7D188F